MRRLALVLATLALAPAAGAQRATFDFTIPNIMRGPEHYGREPQDPRFTPDGQWIYFNWLPPGSPWNKALDPYRVRAAAGSTPERLTRAQMDSAAPLVASGPISPDRTQRVTSVDGDLWIVDLARSTARRLTQTPINEASPAWSADGKRIFFVRDGGNVMALDLDATKVTQLTDVRPAPAPPTPPKPEAQRAALETDQKALFEAIRERALADSIAMA